MNETYESKLCSVINEVKILSPNISFVLQISKQNLSKQNLNFGQFLQQIIPI